MKKRLKRVKKSRVFPTKYKGKYEKKLRTLEKKVKAERKELVQVLKEVTPAQLILTGYVYKKVPYYSL